MIYNDVENVIILNENEEFHKGSTLLSSTWDVGIVRLFSV